MYQDKTLQITVAMLMQMYMTTMGLMAMTLFLMTSNLTETQITNNLSMNHMFWIFGHPEVYLLVLPAFAMLMNKKKLLNHNPYTGMTDVLMLGMITYGHHMYLNGLPVMYTTMYYTMSIAVSYASMEKTLGLNEMKNYKLTQTHTMTSYLLLLGGMSSVMMTTLSSMMHDSYMVVMHFHYMVLTMGTAMALLIVKSMFKINLKKNMLLMMMFMYTFPVPSKVYPLNNNAPSNYTHMLYSLLY